MKKILILSLFALLAASCLKYDPFICRSLVMGNIDNGVMTVDGGLTFYIQKSDVEIKAEPTDRVLALVDVLETVGESKTDYNVNLLEYVIPLRKDPKPASGVTEEDAVGDDPAGLVKSWFSGGHCNLQILYYGLVNSETKHTFDLVYNDARSHSDTLFFEVHHNAFGETLGSENVTVNNLGAAYAYATFPVADYIPEDKETIIIQLSGTWYEDTGLVSDVKTIPFKNNYEYVVANQ